MSKYSIEGLINNEIYFSSFSEFNDPFEFSNPMTDLSKYNEKARDELEKLYKNGVICEQDYLRLTHEVREPSEEQKNERAVLLDKIEKGLIDFGVYCLSEVNDNILMWSHYAEEHKGFCIEFERLACSLSENCMELKVNYIQEYQDLNNPKHLINFYVEMFSNSNALGRKKWQSKYKRLGEAVRRAEDGELGCAVLRNKFIDWAYEKEVRLINRRVGSHKYKPKSIKRIVFGLRMSDRDKATIQNICKSEDKKHIVFAQAIKRKQGFGIEVVENAL